MKLGVGVATDIGRVSEKNEDSYLVEEPLFAVAGTAKEERSRRG